MTKVLVTGSNGFVGRNLCLALAQRKDVEVLLYDIESTADELDQALDVVDVIFHLAGVNRPTHVEEYKTGNADFTESLCASLQRRGRTPFIVLSSSTQAALDNPYGVSKRQAEIAVENYAQNCASILPSSSLSPRLCASALKSCIYRLPNVFGKGCRPNYNSAVATWCHNIANGLPIQVRDPAATVTLVYVDDVVDSFIHRLHRLTQIDEVEKESGICDNPCNLWIKKYCEIPITYTKTLGEITALIESFRSSRSTLQIPDQADGFTKKLYATYLSYLPVDQFSYPLKMNVDARGSFTEMLKTPDRGQVSVNISKPGIVKGNHWHHTKVEKFLVVSGRGVIRFRKVDECKRRDAETQSGNDVLEYRVSGEKLEVVDIPPGYTHNIENLGDTDMVTVMWASEAFDPERPDTFFEVV
jgi:UDP-2-acetamido-2,6-beta-L-arabino-hexul-4-ose reductase